MGLRKQQLKEHPQAVDAQCSTVHEQLASPGVSSSVFVICELEIQEKTLQNGRAKGQSAQYVKAPDH
ncbi:hypothetical protein Y1Q_0018578 [Alligator mississippiensis]|uniref:Uncharacterized protein n=1 Tax=Alligator mississippiensis TaxID=8496 RepID=A0A151PH00_ALLMI|nr:hypothetical protein Y1Q_0018578 [Alligator mississippiensis]